MINLVQRAIFLVVIALGLLLSSNLEAKNHPFKEGQRIKEPDKGIIYVIEAGKRRSLPNAVVYKRLFGNAKYIVDSRVKLVPLGLPIPNYAILFKGRKRAEVYFLDRIDGKMSKRWVTALEPYGLSWGGLQVWSELRVKQISANSNWGSPIKSYATKILQLQNQLKQARQHIARLQATNNQLKARLAIFENRLLRLKKLFVGKFASPKMKMDIRHQNGRFSGTLLFMGKTFPFTATHKNNALHGTFISAGKSFSFTVTSDGKKIVFQTGKFSNTLMRK